MLVCVTGGTGFLGSALVRRLLAGGDSVRVLARNSSRADNLEKRGIEVIRGDLNDSDAIEKAVRGCDVVYHAGAKVEGRSSAKEHFETNVRGTEGVLRASLRAGAARVIVVSSVAVYGLVKEAKSIDENTPFDPNPQWRDFYSQSKIQADRLAQAFAQEKGLPVTIVRPGIIYGPGRKLPAGLLGFRTGRGYAVFGGRNHRLPLNYVENIANALQFAARENDRRLHQYIAIDDPDLTLAQFHLQRAKIEKTPTLFLPGWPSLITTRVVDAIRKGFGLRRGSFSTYQVRRALQDRAYDSRLIRAETGWSPPIALAEALSTTLKIQG